MKKEQELRDTLIERINATVDELECLSADKIADDILSDYELMRLFNPTGRYCRFCGEPIRRRHKTWCELHENLV